MTVFVKSTHPHDTTKIQLSIPKSAISVILTHPFKEIKDYRVSTLGIMVDSTDRID